MGLEMIGQSASTVMKLCQAELWTNATKAWGITQDVLEKYTDGVNFYNILQWTPSETTKQKYRRLTVLGI